MTATPGCFYPKFSRVAQTVSPSFSKSFSPGPASPSLGDQQVLFPWTSMVFLSGSMLVLLSGTSYSFSCGPASPSPLDQLVFPSGICWSFHQGLASPPPSGFSLLDSWYFSRGPAGPFHRDHLVLHLWTSWSFSRGPAGASVRN